MGAAAQMTQVSVQDTASAVTRISADSGGNREKPEVAPFPADLATDETGSEVRTN
jgi:hypothetical protein